VLVCVDHKNRFHEAVMASGTWAVSILAESAQEAATWFATRGRRLQGQVDRVPHRRSPVCGAALLDGALGWLDCRTSQVHEGGDHSIVVGQVVWAAVNDEADDPLLYYRSHYAALLHSAASEKSVLALRESIVEDSGQPPSEPPHGERTARV